MTTAPVPLADRVAKALADEDARTCGWGHGFLDRYGVDAETDGFVDAVLAAVLTPPLTADERPAGQPEPVTLATPCARPECCRHPYNWHVPGPRCSAGPDGAPCPCPGFLPPAKEHP